jgi:hypothetical protein
MDGGDAIRFNAVLSLGTLSLLCTLLRAKPMKKLLLATVLVSLPAMCWPSLAQTRLTPKGVTARADNCAPIGRTANGELVYSMKCENLPAPSRPAPQAELREATPPAEPEPEVKRSGLFGMSYEVKRPDQ